MAENTYYYRQLDKEKQRAYHAIKTGLLALAPSFAVPKLEPRDLADIYFMVRMDNPEIFYTVKYSYRFYQQADNVELIPEYLFPKKQIMQHQEAMKARVAKLARQAEKMSEADKEQYIHDFMLVEHCYDPVIELEERYLFD